MKTFSELRLESIRDEVIELKLYIENDSDLYRQKIVPIVKNIQRKMTTIINIDLQRAHRAHIIFMIKIIYK